MKKRITICILLSLRCASLVALVAALGIIEARASESSLTLWQIGRQDHDNGEFALAPGGYAEFALDGFFVVGRSNPERDWPYVQPGPAARWAGDRRHTFTIVFALKEAPDRGQCNIEVGLTDNNRHGPPRVRFRINDKVIEKDLPRGAGRNSVRGPSAKGKPYHFDIPFSATALRAGDNEIHITTLSGGWLLYDWLRFEAPAGLELAEVSEETFIKTIRPVRAIQRQEGRSLQPLRLELYHFGEETDAVVEIEGGEAQPIRLVQGPQAHEVLLPAVKSQSTVRVRVATRDRTLADRKITVKPVRQLTVYILPHSHTDIGFTELQTVIEKKQIENLRKGIRYARQTADYPEGARFVWNVEVLWAADLYLRRLPEPERAAFIEAVKKGQVGLNGMYLNELTGLCRPEELLRLCRFSNELSELCGVSIDSAMASDVPGYTWGTVVSMAQAGIRYFSTAPNYADRIGSILLEWENKPFYWVAPCGREKVLVWIPFQGYATSHVFRELSQRFVEYYQKQLEISGYPYDVTYLRWAGKGDNAEPDLSICDFVKDWNAKYEWPRFVIASTSEAFSALEARYGPRLPRVRGDWTPYWEDGAGSSALETAANRASSDRLSQAEALWAMKGPADYPRAAFEEAWKNVLLYSEHTWGASCSVSDPENERTKEQWAIKQSYCLEAQRQSRQLLERAAQRASAGSGEAPSGALDLFNTTSWPRTELVVVPQELSGGDRVTDDRGRAVASQRLRDGELAFLAREVPPFAARRYFISAGAPHVPQRATSSGAVLHSSRLHVRLDETTGAIVELRAADIEGNFADTTSGYGLNDYLYLPGDDLADIERNAPVKIRTKENGPLLASLVVESEAPGCNRLSREVRLVAGLDHVELLNLVDKKRAPISPHPPDGDFATSGGKESVNFAFPFDVPAGETRIDIPFTVIRPDTDQMPSACKNWFSVGRWVDVAGPARGITWVTLDAPLVQIGGITANLLGPQTDPALWRKRVGPTQKLFAWVMNNHWRTNYRAYQEGPVRVRFVLRPHHGFDAAEASRFATGFSQPLVVTAARGATPATSPRLRVEPTDVLVTALGPSDDGRALMVRLFGASGATRKATIRWNGPRPSAVFRSDTSQRRGVKVDGPIEIPGWGLITLRAEFE